MTLDKNATPYYDDFDPTKKYYQILFRPDIPVQARELSQIQSLLQNQVKNFGDSIYKNGSMVLPGTAALNTQYNYVKLDDLFDSSTTVNINNFKNQKVIGLTSGSVATVLQVEDTDGVDPKTLYVQYQVGVSSQPFTASISNDSKVVTGISISANSQLVVGALVSGTGIPANTYIVSVDSDTQITLNNEATATNASAALIMTTSDQFLDGETIQTIGGTQNYSANVADGGTGVGSAATIQLGVYYINGFFVLVPPQTVLLDKYTNTPSYRIGLNYIDDFVTANTDISLNDPAAGAPNFNAPGADRYYIDLLLTKLDFDTTVPENFIELINVKSGIIQSQVTNPSYSVLEKEFARRMADEAGNFTVNPFPLQIKEDLNDGSNFGVYTASQGGDESMVDLSIGAGKAYVSGYEITSPSTQLLKMNKARNTLTSTNQPLSFALGNFIDCDHVKGTFNISTYDAVSLWNIGGTKIGNALVRGFKLIDGTPGTTNAVYRLWLFNIEMLAEDSVVNYSFKDTRTIYVGASVDATHQAKPIIDSFTGEIALLEDVADNTAILPIQTYAIKTFLNDDNSITNQYTVRRTYAAQAMTTTTLTLNAGTGALFESFDELRYHVSIKTASATALGNGYVNGSVIDMAAGSNSVVLAGSPTGSQVVLTIPTISGSTIDVTATLVKNNIQAKTKTLTTNTQSTVAFDDTITLAKADVFSLVSVIDDTTSADITSQWTLDSGQRDNLYDLGSITFNTDYAVPAGTVTITYKYFAHGNGDFFSVDSYAGVVDYVDIPMYISTTSGTQYDLINSLDFRPRVGEPSGTGFSVYSEIVEDGGEFTNTYVYYTGQINKLYLDYLGNFKLIYGNSGINPHPPADPTDGMVLYTLQVPPYTFSAKDIKTVMTNNRGYTMRDIGTIDARVSNLEYYTALSLLEQNTADMFIDDGTGQNRFKNGFIVDNFNSFSVGNILLQDYQASIDTTNGIMRPTFLSDNIKLLLNSGSSSFYQQTGQLITLPYTVASFIKQGYASTFDNINPYNIFNWVGTLSLSPSTDDWYNTTAAPDITITNTDSASMAAAAAKLASMTSTTPGSGGTPVTLFTDAGPHNTSTTDTWVLSSSWTSTITGSIKVAATIQSFDAGGHSGALAAVPGRHTSAIVRVNGTQVGEIASTSGYTAATGSINCNVKVGDSVQVYFLCTTGVYISSQIRNVAISTITPVIAPTTASGDVVWGAWQTTWTGQILSDIQQPQPTGVITNKNGFTGMGNNGLTAKLSTQAGITALFGGRTPDIITGATLSNDTWHLTGTITNTQIVSQQEGQTRTGTQYTIQPTTTTTVLSNNIINTSIIPFMRTNTVTFTATGMKPSTRVYPFFGGISVSSYCTPTGGSPGDNLVTDISGAVSGTFNIPDDDNIKFRTGSVVFSLIDDANNNVGLADTSASATYTAAGLLNTTQATVQSTVGAKLVQSTVTQTQTIVGTNIQNTKQTVTASWYDPLAQSFLIDSAGGVFLSKINIYFRTKDTNNIPVTLQIRTMVNGYPGPVIVPFSEVTINPSDITLSNDSSVATSFVFSNPIFLQDKQEYCFALVSNSNSYNVFVSEIGGTDLITGAAISTQPYAGSLFESQNTSTWTANQLQDIKFEIFRCVFDTEHTGTVVLDNDVPLTSGLGIDPFTTTNASAVVKVFHPSHGLSTGQKTTIAGVTATSNGITAAHLNGQRTVTVLDYDFYTFVAGGNATSTGRTGGVFITATKNMRLDLGNLISQNIIPTDTSLLYAIKTKGEATQTLAANFSTISANNNFSFEDSQTILSSDNELNHSVVLQALLNTTNDAVSPVLDMTRQSLITIGNRINVSLDVDSAGTDIGETLPGSGNAIARYITNQVSLASPATSMQVYFAAIRPPNCTLAVYIKYLPDDQTGDLPFDDLGYTLMTPVVGGYPNADATTFFDYQFDITDLNPFSVFSIKIVMLAADTSDAPTIKQFRAIATGT